MRSTIVRSLLAAFTYLLASCAESIPCSHIETAPNSAASAQAATYQDTGDPFFPGNLAVHTIDVDACDFGAPTALRIHAPVSPDEYPVVVFQHGFMLRNSAYDEILQHVASHGFVVVAPQMYEPGIGPLLGNPTAAEEAELGRQILNWLPNHLQEVTQFAARTDRIGIAGHSRGGKVAWLMAVADPGRFLGIAGVDPVDGAGGPFGNQSRVTQGTFPFSIPALIIGTELGGDCAPTGDNHVQFYAASQSPAWHFVALNEGHGDMLDEPEAQSAAAFCASDPDRSGMRQLTAGLLTFLFRAALQGDSNAYQYLREPMNTPIAVIAESR